MWNIPVSFTDLSYKAHVKLGILWRFRDIFESRYKVPITLFYEVMSSFTTYSFLPVISEEARRMTACRCPLPIAPGNHPLVAMTLQVHVVGIFITIQKVSFGWKLNVWILKMAQWFPLRFWMFCRWLWSPSDSPPPQSHHRMLTRLLIYRFFEGTVPD